MGLSDRGDESIYGSIFSNDVLRITFSIKDENHLSFINVLGNFKNITMGVTTKSDIVLVRKMV